MRGMLLVLVASLMLNCKKPQENYTNCNLSYQPESTELKWTAYKFTEKTGVTGKLKNFTLKGTQIAKEIQDVFSNAEFSVDPASVDSSNPERDAKIREHFFGNLAEKGRIYGRFVKEGTFYVELTFNGIKRILPVEIQQRSPLEYSAKVKIDLNNFNAQAAVKKLNEICHELHIGADGVSKLWPDVDVEIHTKLKPECP